MANRGFIMFGRHKRVQRPEIAGLSSYIYVIRSSVDELKVNKFGLGVEIKRSREAGVTHLLIYSTCSGVAGLEEDEENVTWPTWSMLSVSPYIWDLAR